MAQVMSRLLSLPISHLTPDPSPPGPGSAPRPKDCKLDCSDLLRVLKLDKFQLTPFEKGIAAALEPFANELRERSEKAAAAAAAAAVAKA